MKIIQLALLGALAACVGWACNQPAESSYVQLSGPAQGSTFSITYEPVADTSYVADIARLLTEVDASMSTYIDNSLISKWNAHEVGAAPFAIGPHMLSVYATSRAVHRATNGAFDPTVMPLVTYWGFHQRKAPEGPIDSVALDSVRALVDFNKVLVLETVHSSYEPEKLPADSAFLLKTEQNIQLDFNAVAQGYTVDLLGEFLEAQGITNYMVEVGGEVRTKGHNSKGEPWSIGIDKPVESTAENRELHAVIAMENRSLATSGNYRKFYVRDGVKYAHTLNPRTGFPVQHSLLSATVLASTCAEADAYATAFMVLGTESAKAFLNEHPELEAYLIFADAEGNLQTWMSEGLEEKITEREAQR